MKRAATWYSGVVSSGDMGLSHQPGDGHPGPDGLDGEALEHDVELDRIKGDSLSLPEADGRPNRFHDELLPVGVEVHDLLRHLGRQQLAHLDERGLLVHACTSPVRNWFIALASA